jgi:uncharacterized coiled-coil protein SlyX
MSLGPSLPLAPCSIRERRQTRVKHRSRAVIITREARWSVETASPHGPLWTISFAKMPWRKIRITRPPSRKCYSDRCMYDALRSAIAFDADHPVPRRRLEDRIQDLAGKAVAAQNSEELNDVIRELRAALREHAARLRKLAAEKLLTLPKAERAPPQKISGLTT